MNKSVLNNINNALLEQGEIMGKGTKTKATKARVTITPKVKMVKDAVEVGTLKVGDCFMSPATGNLFQLTDEDPEGVCLSNGVKYDFASEELVRPVDVKIQWTYRK